MLRRVSAQLSRLQQACFRRPWRLSGIGLPKRVIWIAAFCCFLANGSSLAQEYRLGAGDKIKIQVHDWPAISGQYRVSTDGTITLPIIGAFSAGGTTVHQLGNSITERLREKTETKDVDGAIVDIVEHRPFFILGEVQKPGEYEYQPQLSVLKAVSKAGGYYRLDNRGLLRFERDAISARGQYLSLETVAQRLHVQIARLNAQLRGDDTFDLPDSLQDVATRPSIRSVLEQERAILKADRSALEQKIQSQRGLKDILDREIRSLTLQIEAESKQLDFVQKEATKIRALGERGLAQGSRILDLERNIAQITGSRQAIETQIIRARQEIHRAEQRGAEERSAELVRLRKELQTATDRLNEVTEQLRMNAQLVAEAEVAGPRAALESEANETHKFSIVREEDGSPKEFAVTETSEVRPGDIVKVQRLPRASSQLLGTADVPTR